MICVTRARAVFPNVEAHPWQNRMRNIIIFMALTLHILLSFSSPGFSANFGEKDIEKIESIYRFILELKGINRYLAIHQFLTGRG
jgi:hypothetical protein